MFKIDPEKETNKIVQFIKKTFKKSNINNSIIAVSGGVDSAASLLLLSRAMPLENIYAVMLPYKNQSIKEAEEVIKQVKIPKKNIFNINIEPIVSEFSRLLISRFNLAGRLARRRLGNIMARTRMVIAYDLAKKVNGLVCGTENRSEYYLGYFTLWGDQASDFEPIRHLYKTQVYELAKYLGVPKEILSKAPSAGLWPGQTDEEELGIKYAEADKIFYNLFDLKKTPEEIIKIGTPKERVEKVLGIVKRNLFKHQLPVELQSSSLTS